MLIKMDTLRAIERGEITTLFRRWKRPAAKAGGRQRTPIGELAIDAVDPVDPAELTDTDARAAGFGDRDELLGELARRDGTVYRIAVRYDRADPRLALRDDVGAEAVASVVAKLRKKDARADRPWTLATLRTIGATPGRRAADLAAELGHDKLPFKRRVRQLKELGLTVSLDVGYRLSPRGEAVLRAMDV